MAGLHSGPLSLSSCGRLHWEDARQARMATVVCTNVESTRGEPGFGDSTVVVAPTTHHRVDEGGRGAHGTQPHRFFVQNSNDTMAQHHVATPFRNMMLGVVRDGRRVDVGTLPQAVRWKHVSMRDVIRIDNVYTTADADPAGVVHGACTKWMDSSVYADVTLTSGAPATEVPAAFLMQDKLPWVSLMMRNLSDTQTEAIHTVRGMERANIQSAKDARGEL